MASKICVWIVGIYRLVRLWIVLTVGTVYLKDVVGPWRLFSQCQDLCTSYVIVFGVWIQAAGIPSACPPLLIFRLTKTLLLSVGPRRASNM